MTGTAVYGEDRLDEDDIAAIAGDVFLQCALETTIVRGAALERFLTRLRAALLRVAEARCGDGAPGDECAASLFCALAQQCFLNEYVFAQDAEETRRAHLLCDLLQRQMATGGEISALLLAAVAAYRPLHELPSAEVLLARTWPSYGAELVRLQVREPLEEIEDRRGIAVLTPIADEVSLRVMRQYEENPYPRWTLNPFVVAESLGGADGAAARQTAAEQILIAGCGTGEHPVGVAQRSQQARILAVDLSLTSLAYARRKTREAGLQNIDYAQADILELGALGRVFDRIEAIGVLHHLADPQAGLRVLLSLLAPRGVMRVGLYSELARRSIVAARELIAALGYGTAAADIRAFRQSLLRAADERRWETLLRNVDFYSMSGCRDMLFNVMERRFTIPEVAALLRDHALAFEGFELAPQTLERFASAYPTAAPTDLDCWAAFEAANPDTFRSMYMFTVRRAS